MLGRSHLGPRADRDRRGRQTNLTSVPMLGMLESCSDAWVSLGDERGGEGSTVGRESA